MTFDLNLFIFDMPWGLSRPLQWGHNCCSCCYWPSLHIYLVSEEPPTRTSSNSRGWKDPLFRLSDSQPFNGAQRLSSRRPPLSVVTGCTPRCRGSDEGGAVPCDTCWGRTVRAVAGPVCVHMGVFERPVCISHLSAHQPENTQLLRPDRPPRDRQ